MKPKVLPVVNNINAMIHNNNEPLHQHVERAIQQYFQELEGEVPTNLYELILSEVEKPLLSVVLQHTKGNQSKCASVLGLNRGTLRKKLKLYGFL